MATVHWDCQSAHRTILRRCRGWCCVHTVITFMQGLTGFSNRPCLIRQTGPISSCITRNLGASANNLSKESPASIAKGPWVFSILLPPSIYHVVTHLDGRPTGPLGKCQAARWPSLPLPSWSCYLLASCGTAKQTTTNKQQYVLHTCMCVYISDD